MIDFFLNFSPKSEFLVFEKKSISDHVDSIFVISGKKVNIRLCLPKNINMNV